MAAACKPSDPPTVDETRAVIDQLLDVLSNRRFDELPSLFVPGANYWILGDPARFPMGGDHTPLEVARSAGPMLASFAEFSVTTLSRTTSAAGGAWAGTIRGTRPDLTAFPVYENSYAMVFETARDRTDGKVRIKVVREYMDLLIMMAFAQALGAAGQGGGQ